MGFFPFAPANAIAAPPGQIYSPIAYGAVGDGVHLDDAAIAAAIAAIPSAGGILDLSGARVTYLVSVPIKLNTGVSVQGTFINNQDSAAGANKADVTCASTFAGVAVMADAGALATGASPSASLPVTIRGVSFDLSQVPGGQTPDCIRLMTFRSDVHRNFIRMSQNSTHAIHITATNAGANLITNTAVENSIWKNWIVGGPGGSGIFVDSTASKLTDGFCMDNLIEMASVNLGSAYNSSGAAIDIETGADWQVRGNHVYRVPGHGIIVNHAFTSFVCNNKVDNFGTQGTAATTYRGIWVNGCNGPSTEVSGNEIDTDESHGTATTNYNYFQVDGANSLNGVATLTDNAVRKTANGAGGASIAISSNAGTAGSMRITEWGTTSQFTGTATSGPTLTPNLTNGATALRGPMAAAAYSNPANPTGNGTVTTEAAGLALAYTPVLSGKILVTITGYVLTTVAVTTITMRLTQGTGAAPTNGATTGLGTAFGLSITTQAPSTTVAVPFTLSGVVTGLVPGTAIWADIIYSSGAAGDVATLTNLSATIQEVN